MNRSNEPSNIEVGKPRDDAEVSAFVDIVSDALYFADADLDAWLEREGVENIRVVRVDGQVAGGMSYQRMGQWFGGHAVPMGAVRAVGIGSEFRAAGAASAMLCAVLEEMRAEGIPLATLYPSTQKVYRNAGFEKAGIRRQYRLPSHRIDVRDRALDIRPLTSAVHEELKAVYGQWARRTAGVLDRSPWVWQRLLDPPPWIKSSKGYVATRDGAVEGYIVMSTHLTGAPHDHTIEVQDFVATTPAAARRLWTFLADHRSMASTVTWPGSEADPMRYLLDEQGFDITLAIDWMMRIVDVPAALAARGYPPGLTAELHLDIRDNVLAHNNQRFVLAVEDGRGHAEPGGRGDLTLDVRGLAPLYSGHLSARALLNTAYVDDGSMSHDAVLDTASAIFAGPAPWMADMF